MEPKEARTATDYELSKLKGEIDKRLLQKESQFLKHRGAKKTQAFWNLFTTSVEKGILSYFKSHEVKTAGNKGRGFVNIISKQSIEE